MKRRLLTCSQYVSLSHHYDLSDSHLSNHDDDCQIISRNQFQLKCANALNNLSNSGSQFNQVAKKQHVYIKRQEQPHCSNYVMNQQYSVKNQLNTDRKTQPIHLQCIKQDKNSQNQSSIIQSQQEMDNSYNRIKSCIIFQSQSDVMDSQNSSKSQSSYEVKYQSMPTSNKNKTKKAKVNIIKKETKREKKSKLKTKKTEKKKSIIKKTKKAGKKKDGASNTIFNAISDYFM